MIFFMPLCTSRRLLHYLTMLALRESAADCLREIISKGMEPLPKIELVESLAKTVLSMHILSIASKEVHPHNCRV